MAYKVTLKDGWNDIAFVFANMSLASEFIEIAFDAHLGEEKDDGKTKLVVKIECTSLKPSDF